MATNSSTLEERLRIVEDRLAIYNLLAAHPPGADTGLAAFINNIYTEDGSIDRGEGLASPKSRDEILANVNSDIHKKALFEEGLGHFSNTPFVELRGDEAFATSYILLIVPDKKGEMRNVSNHGDSTGYRIHRHVVTRWELKRTAQGWQVKTRRIRFHDGSNESRDLLRQAASYYQ